MLQLWVILNKLLKSVTNWRRADALGASDSRDVRAKHGRHTNVWTRSHRGLCIVSNGHMRLNLIAKEQHIVAVHEDRVSQPPRSIHAALHAPGNADW